MSESDLTEGDLVGIVKSSFPELDTSRSRVVNTGWENYVVVVNEEKVFKIPRSSGFIPTLRLEVALLDCLDDSPIPVPRNVGARETDDSFLAGFTFLPGEPLYSVKSLTGEMRRQLSEFLTYMSGKAGNICVSDVLGHPDVAVWRNRYANFREHIFSTLLEVLDMDVMSDLARKFSSFMDDLCSTLVPSPIHADLYRGNVLVDPEGGYVTGIIDWGTSCVGDPAMDFAALAVDFPLSEVLDILDSYSGPVDENFRDRMEFYWEIEPLYGILYFMNRDRQSFRYMSDQLVSRLKTGLH